MKKRFNIFPLAIAAAVCAAPASSYAYENVADAISWAQDEDNRCPGSDCRDPEGDNWINWCMRFVANCYGKKNAGMNAIGGWYTSEFGAQESSFPPPAGALVFFDTSKTPYGHVGLSIGNGRMIHAHYKKSVREDRIPTGDSPYGKYLGWRWPTAWTPDEPFHGGGPKDPDPDDPPVAGFPDFIIDKVVMSRKKSGGKERYVWKINETAYVVTWIDNIGDADWEGDAKKIKVPFYLSKGKKEDRHSEWIRVGREKSKKNNLRIKKKPKRERIKFDLLEWANEGKVLPGRTYNFVACADRPKDEGNKDGDVKEKHKSNNCSTEAVFYVDFGPPRDVDLMADNLALTGGRTELQGGERYGLRVDVSNIGTEQPWNGFRTSYELKGPGTGGVWQRIGEDKSKASSLYPGAIHFEAMDGDDEISAPMVGGDYIFRACADYEQVVPETDESNNCTEITFEVKEVPAGSPRIVITNPTHDDDWRSDSKEHDVRWDYFDFPVKGHVMVEYSLDGGATWRLIDDETTNDGKKHWEDMCDYHTIDTHHAYIRVTSLEYPYVYDISDEFAIDHAKECE
ncbi:MAG: CHAP domain-containing protein [Candidatus Electrothrix sp. YB6]